MGGNLKHVGRAMAAVAVAVSGLSLAPEAAGAEGVGVVGLRSASGLPELAGHAALDELARNHAASMAASGVLAHADLGAAMAGAGRPARLGQVAGTGSSTAEIDSTFLGSSLHRGVILGDYDVVGIGTAVGGDGRVWLSAIFAKWLPTPVAPTVQAAAPAPVRQVAAPVVRKPVPRKVVRVTRTRPRARR